MLVGQIKLMPADELSDTGELDKVYVLPHLIFGCEVIVKSAQGSCHRRELHPATSTQIEEFLSATDHRLVAVRPLSYPDQNFYPPPKEEKD